MNSIEEKLNYVGSEVNPRLNKFLDERLQEAKNLHPQAGILVEEIKRFINIGGKRARPTFLYAGYLSVGGTDVDAVFDLAMTVELLHTWALIHDDIIDRSSTRRGAPTSHIYWRDEFKNLGLTGDSAHFGISTAILAGDLAFSFADTVFKQFNNSKQAQNYWDQVKFEVLHGEYLDVLFSFKARAEEKDIRSVLNYKTARYTVEKPLLIGAAFGGGDRDQIDALSEYGLKVGQVFQLQDDIQGIFGEEKKLGKSVSSDLMEGKKTLLILSVQKKADQKGKELLKRVLGNQKATEKDLERVRTLIRDCGALRNAQDLVDQLTDEALVELDKASLTLVGKEWLSQFAQYLRSLAK